MKRSSLQWKLTLWFSAALVLMAVLTFIVVFFVSHSVLQKQLRTELIHTVEDNVDEVEFYRSIAQMDQDGDTDHYIRYGVDMIYFTSDEKRQEMEEKVIYAVSSAISWLDNDANRRSNRDRE